MTTRILVLADTHVPARGRSLPSDVLSAADDVDLIVHLGDLTAMEVIDDLARFAPVRIVHGNVDPPDVQAAYPAFLRLSVEGRELVLLHGHLGGRTALSAARSVSGGDAVLFGHSHQPYSATESGRLLFNPGSPTDRRRAPRRSFGILTVADSIEPTLVSLEP